MPIDDREVSEETLRKERESKPVSEQQRLERAQEPPTQQGPLPTVSKPPAPAATTSVPNRDQGPKDA